MLLFSIVLLAMIAIVVFAAVRESGREVRPRPTVSELRREAGAERRSEPPTMLFLEHDTFIFVSSSSLERRLDHRIEDEDGRELGAALQQPRPGRFANAAGAASHFSDARVEICDTAGGRVAGLLRRRGVLRRLEVLDENRIPVGTVSRDGRRRFAMADVLGRRVGTIHRRSRGNSVDYAIEDPGGRPLGTISGLDFVAERLGLSPPAGRWTRLFGRGQPEEHVLEIDGAATRDLRILMLGAAAGLYLVLQAPWTDSG